MKKYIGIFLWSMLIVSCDAAPSYGGLESQRNAVEREPMGAVKSSAYRTFMRYLLTVRIRELVLKEPLANIMLENANHSTIPTTSLQEIIEYGIERILGDDPIPLFGSESVFAAIMVEQGIEGREVHGLMLSEALITLWTIIPRQMEAGIVHELVHLYDNEVLYSAQQFRAHEDEWRANLAYAYYLGHAATPADDIDETKDLSFLASKGVLNAQGRDEAEYWMSLMNYNFEVFRLFDGIFSKYFGVSIETRNVSQGLHEFEATLASMSADCAKYGEQETFPVQEVLDCYGKLQTAVVFLDTMYAGAIEDQLGELGDLTRILVRAIPFYRLIDTAKSILNILESRIDSYPQVQYLKRMAKYPVSYAAWLRKELANESPHQYIDPYWKEKSIGIRHISLDENYDFRKKAN